MSVRYGAGAVWWTLINFGKGEGEQKKFFVLLTDCPEVGEPFAVLTTSKGMWYPDQSLSPCLCPGYSAYRIDQEQVACFGIDTYVQFDNPVPVPVTRAFLNARTQEGTGGFLQTLGEELLRSILNCATRSEDVAKGTIQRIKGTLDARKAAAKLGAQAAKSASLTKAPAAPKAKGPLDDLRDRFEKRCASCRRTSRERFASRRQSLRLSSPERKELHPISCPTPNWASSFSTATLVLRARSNLVR